MERYRGARRPLPLRVLLLALRAVRSSGLQSISVFRSTGFSLWVFLDLRDWVKFLQVYVLSGLKQNPQAEACATKKRICIHLK